MSKRLTGAERRSIILDQAGRLFAFKGLHGTTTREIAKAAGVSEPILYQHFKSKEEIYETLEMMCRTQTAYFKQVVRDIGTGIDSLIVITYLLSRVISFCKMPGVETKPQEYGTSEILLRLAGYSFLEDGRFAKALVENCIGAFFEQWHDSYKTAFNEGLLDVEKAEELSLWFAYQSLIGMGMYVLPGQRLIAKIKDQDEASKSATLFLLRAIGVKESVIKQKVDWAVLRKYYQRAGETERALAAQAP